MTRKSYLATFVLFGIALSGCLPSQQQATLQRDMDETKRRLAYLERRVTAESLDMQDGKGPLASMTQKQADIQADMDHLRVEIQSLKGRMDELNQQSSRQQEELALLRDQLIMKTSDLESRLTSASAPQTAGTAPSSPAATENDVEPEELYKQGLDLVREKGDFAAGRKMFRSFLAAHPQHPLAANAMYWIGETYYAEKDYESAIVHFQEVIQKFPQHPKAASALLKQGLSFQGLGDDKSALILFEKAVASFPHSPEARIAQEKVTELNKK